jgi:hypothetical protein
MNVSSKVFLTVAILSVGLTCGVSGADESQKTNGRPRAVSPEQRKARLEELRERNPEAFRKLREEMERHREEFKKLPPAERDAKIKELREQFLERRKAMTPDERKTKRQEIKGRFEKQLAALREKKTKGTLTTQETRRLERLETIAKRFKQAESSPPEAGKEAPK